MKLIFEAKCMRCDKIIAVDYDERFNGGKEGTSEVDANRLLYDCLSGFTYKCPDCKKDCIFQPVTPVKSST